MKQNIKPFLIILLLFFTTSCGNEDDNCVKTITIPQTYLALNQTYSYNITQEVPCDFPEPTVPQLIDPPFLENFSYEVISFIYTPDTGNNTSRLQFEIKLINSNNFNANGFPYITVVNEDGMESSSAYQTSNSCNQINANSECILIFDGETSLDLGMINSIELVDVEYLLLN